MATPSPRTSYRRRGTPRPPVTDVTEYESYALMCEATPNLFDVMPPHDGPDLTPDDERRLGRQHIKVFDLMRAGSWWTLRELGRVLGEPETSISARIRDFRKEKFGSHTVERERVSGGLWRYRLVVR